MHFIIPEGVQKILDILSKEGYQGYLVGGCVRDFLLGRKAKDWDITTNAPVDTITEILEEEKMKIIPVGIQMGTIVAILHRQEYQITTFRKREQPKYQDPLVEDLSLRDFTMNAMAYHPDCGLIDPFRGQEDLKKKRIRAVGESKHRFVEDPLRILRAVRFSIELGFPIDPKMIEDIAATKALLENISKERIRDELNKMLLCDQPSRTIRSLVDFNLLDFTIPELTDTLGFDQQNPHHDKDVFDHTMTVLDNTPKDLVVRLAALLHDIGKPKTFFLGEDGIGHFYTHENVSRKIATRILRRLKYSRKTIAQVSTLVKEHMFHAENVSLKGVKRLMNRLGEENLERFFQLKRADALGTKPPHDLSHLDELKEKCQEVLKEEQALSIRDLKIDGYDLIKMGIPQGKEIGEILDYLLDKVLEEPELNEREKLMRVVGERIKS